MRLNLKVLALLVFVSLLLMPKTMATRIPDELKKAICFIYAPDTKGQPVPSGTGFFVGVNLPQKAERIQIYLVTAKHVLEDSNGQLLKKIWVRMNRLTGDAQLLPVELGGTGARVHFHPTDTTVDLAVMTFIPDSKTFDFKVLPADFLTTREQFKEMHITEGSDVFFTGLFTPHVGERKNYPIVRFGRVAMISDELIPWQNRPNEPVTKLELYLMESQSFGGNSGSPVFFYLGSDREPGSIILGTPVLKLAGVMKGNFSEGRPIGVVDTGDTTRIPVSLQNVGIAAVVPSHLLHEILFSAELRAQRDSIR